MTYDQWKTTNPADNELGEAEQKPRHELVKTERWRREVYLYRDYIIWYEMTPVPTRAWDWHYQHEDFDLDDHRFGHCPSLAQCMGEIDDWIEDHEEESE